MNDVPARLIVKLGPNPEKEYTLSQSEITIGRSSGNSIVIPNAEVSRRHAKIRRDGDRYFIEDWGSTNGTFVSGQRVMGLTILRDGDKIRLADNIILQYLDEPINLNPPEEDQFVAPESEVTIVDTTPPLPSPIAKIPEPQPAPVVEIQIFSLLITQPPTSPQLSSLHTPPQQTHLLHIHSNPYTHLNIQISYHQPI